MKSHGYIYFEPRASVGAAILDALRKNGDSSFVVARHDIQPERFEIVLICCGWHEITFAGLSHRRGVGTSGQAKLRVSHPVWLRINARALYRFLNDEAKRYLEDVFLPGSSVRPTEEVWNALWGALVRTAPDGGLALQRLQQEVLRLRMQRVGPTTAIAQFERDSIGLAAKIADIEAGPLLSGIDLSRVHADTPAVLLLPEGRIEDRYVDHDGTLFPGLRLRDARVGYAKLSGKSCTLEIFNVNRERVETATGADLVYHNVTEDSFVLVQYKMMKRYADGRWYYRPEGSAHEASVKRMQGARAQFPRYQVPARRESDYRLSDECFFLKLCENDPASVGSGSLVPGALFGLGYWEFLEQLGFESGPHGAKVVIPANHSRHLSNTLFSTAVWRCWVGTSRISMQAMGAMVNDLLADRHSVTIAVEQPE